MGILGIMMQQGMSQSSGSRMTNVLGAGSSGGSLNDLLGSLSQMMGGGGLAMLASLAFSALKKAGQAPSQVPRALLEPQTPQDQQH